MKKIILLMIAIFIFSGCSVKNIKVDKNTIINTMFKEKSNLSNTTSPGYKYYIPNEVVLVGRNNFNEKLYTKGNYYYLYVDIVSYYNKVKLEYEEKDNLYYSKKINNKEKEGYIEISKLKDSYFLQIMYNYGKIEAYVNEDDIEKTLIDSGYILSSLKFNDLLAKTKFGTVDDSNNEEKLNIFVPRKEEEFFLNPREQQIEEEVGKEE